MREKMRGVVMTTRFIVDMRTLIERWLLSGPEYITLSFTMKVAIAEYLWGRVWFFHFLKSIQRHHFIKSNWHYVRSIEDLVPKSSFSYKQFLAGFEKQNSFFIF